MRGDLPPGTKIGGQTHPGMIGDKGDIGEGSVPLFSRRAFAAESGAVRVGERFAVPRGGAYYLLAYVRSERTQEVWLRFDADTFGHLWLGADALDITVDAANHSIYRRFPWFSKPGGAGVAQRVTLEASVTPILVRLRNYGGENSFCVAVQDEAGNTVSGVTFE